MGDLQLRHRLMPEDKRCEPMYGSCGLPKGHEGPHYAIDQYVPNLRAEIEAAARAAAMRELLAATAEWRSGTMGRSYHDSLEEVVNRLLAGEVK